MSGFFVARPARAFSCPFAAGIVISETSMRNAKQALEDKLKLAIQVVTLITAIAKLVILVLPYLPF